MPTPQFNPGNALASWRWETVPGVPDPTRAWHDVWFKGEKLGFNSEFVERSAITRGGENLSPLIGKLAPGGELMFDVLNPMQDWAWFALMFGLVANPSVLETGAIQHKMSLIEANSFPSTMEFRISRDDGMPVRFQECRTSSLAIKFAEKTLTELTVIIVPAKGDYWGETTRTVGTSTLLPQIRGIDVRNPSVNYDAISYKMKVIAFTGTTADLQFKRGSASYGATVAGVPRGVWWVATDETGLPLGDRGSPVEVFIPLPSGGDLVANDEYSFASQMPVWVPNYQPVIAVNAVYSAVLKDGAKIEVDSGDITITRGAEGKSGVGGRQNNRTRVRGNQRVVGKLAREYQPVNFRRQLEAGTKFGLTLDLHTQVAIGTTGLLDQAVSLPMATCISKGKSASAESQTTMPEGIDFEADFDGTNPSIAALFTNSIPDLTLA